VEGDSPVEEDTPVEEDIRAEEEYHLEDHQEVAGDHHRCQYCKPIKPIKEN